MRRWIPHVVATLALILVLIASVTESTRVNYTGLVLVGTVLAVIFWPMIRDILLWIQFTYLRRTKR